MSDRYQSHSLYARLVAEWSVAYELQELAIPALHETMGLAGRYFDNFDHPEFKCARYHSDKLTEAWDDARRRMNRTCKMFLQMENIDIASMPKFTYGTKPIKLDSGGSENYLGDWVHDIIMGVTRD